MTLSNPVHEWEHAWWFWNETWTYAYGPYKTEAEAKHALKEYARWLNTGEQPQADLSRGRDSEIANV